MESLISSIQNPFQLALYQFRALADRGIIKAPYPLLYRAGVHYEREPAGQEIWPDIPSILEQVRGVNTVGKYKGLSADCEDLACWRTAELREVDRIKAKPFAKWRHGKTGEYRYHALTLLPDGRLEDPSLTLGMGREEFFAKNDVVGKYKRGEQTPLIMYAKKPDVMIVDPEKPSGYSGGPGGSYHRGVLAGSSSSGDPADSGEDPAALAAWGYNRNDVVAADMNALRELVSGGDLPSEPRGKCSDDEGDILDHQIGWNGRSFVPRTDEDALRRLLGYSR